MKVLTSMMVMWWLESITTFALDQRKVMEIMHHLVEYNLVEYNHLGKYTFVTCICYREGIF